MAGLKDRETNEQQHADQQYDPYGAARDLYNQEKTASNSDESAAAEGDSGKNIAKAKSAEQASWTTKVTGRGVYGNNPMDSHRGLSKANLKALLKRKGPLGLIITIFLGGSIGFGSLFGGALAPLAFVENVTDDLNDQLAAMDIRSDHMLRNKVSTADREAALKGCTKLSIRCKFKTLSTKQVERFKLAGIEVTGEAKGLNGKRLVPTSYKFRGQTMDAQAYADALKPTGNRDLRVAHKRALNMKFLGVSDSSFVGRTLARFGVSKKAPELTGTHDERVSKLMNASGVDDVKNIVFVDAVDEDGNKVEGKYMVQGDTRTPPQTYTAEQKAQLEKSVTKISTAKPPSRLQSNLVKGVSIVGYWDLACSIKNMIGGAAVAAKVANSYNLVKYAMPALSLTNKLKAGDITMEDAQVVGEFFAETDSRKQIADVAGSFTTDSSGQVTPTSGDAGMIDNPNYGKNAMDSPLYQLSSKGTYVSTSTSESQYSLGMGQNALLSGFAGFADILNTLGNVAGNCDFVQNWAVRSIGLIVGVVAAIGTGGGSLAVQGAISGSLIVASMILESIINNALTGAGIPEDMSEAPVERAAATWSGMASVLGQSEMNRGMIPGNAEQMTGYLTAQAKIKNDYIAVEREGANPLDINNQYSFLGSLARSALPYFNGSTSVTSTMGNVLSFTTNSFANIVNPASAYAAPIDQSRFKHCDDVAYTGAPLKLEPDVQCNLRYYLPAEDLAMDTDAVAVYMEENGYVEPDTSSGVPPGYNPPAPQQSQGIAMDMLNGITSSFVNTRNYVNDYGKYLDFCAYRILPFGETFQETGAAGAAEKEWVTGERCLQNDEMIRNFRIYTLDKTISEAEDDDTIVIPVSSTTNGGESGGGTGTGENSGNVNAEGWAFPTLAGSPLAQGFSSTHPALDIGSDPSNNNVPIYAMREGTVLTVGNMPPPYIPACISPTGTIQQAVTIRHVVDGQTYISTYHHVQAGSFTVSPGDTVQAGDRIATMGNTGCSFGQHLHVELWLNAIYGGGSAINLGPILYG